MQEDIIILKKQNEELKEEIRKIKNEAVVQ